MIFSRKDKRPATPGMDAYTLSGMGKTGSDDSAARIQSLEAKVERLTALVESMWSILESKSSLNENHLKARLEKVMELRANRDAPRNTCQKCNQKNPPAKTQCVYCGEPLPKPSKAQDSAFNF